MNLLLFHAHEITPTGQARVIDRRAEHIRKVLKANIGDSLRAGVIHGAAGLARIEWLDDSQIVFQVTLDCPPVPPTIDLVLAIPRPKALSRTLQSAASFSVRRIDLINSWRVDPSYFFSPKLLESKLLEDAQLGCEQGGTTWVPEICLHRLFVPYLQQVLTARLADEPGRRLIVSHPHASHRLEEVLPPGDRGPVTLALGPDGGFIEPELESFRRLGGHAVQMGQAILRTEVAVAALLSQVQLLRRLSPSAG